MQSEFHRLSIINSVQISMEWNFEIMHVHRLANRVDLIFARFIEGQPDFQVKEGAVLGGIPIHQHMEMPRKFDENGKPRLDVFVFRPLNLKYLLTDYFVKGQQIKLVSPD